MIRDFRPSALFLDVNSCNSLLFELTAWPMHLYLSLWQTPHEKIAEFWFSDFRNQIMEHYLPIHCLRDHQILHSMAFSCGVNVRSSMCGYIYTRQVVGLHEFKRVVQAAAVITNSRDGPMSIISYMFIILQEEWAWKFTNIFYIGKPHFIELLL
jgi:hypothetical protein